MSVLTEVLEERTRQRARGYDEAHDDRHTLRELCEHATNRVADANNALRFSSSAAPDQYEKRLIQAAAICVAAVESSRRRRQAQDKEEPVNPVVLAREIVAAQIRGEEKPFVLVPSLSLLAQLADMADPHGPHDLTEIEGLIRQTTPEAWHNDPKFALLVTDAITFVDRLRR